MHYNINDIYWDSVFIRLDTTIALDDLLYAGYELAYSMAMQKGQLYLNLSIPNEFDTTISVRKEYQHPQEIGRAHV